MKYAITIIASTAIFTIFGLLAAWNVIAYQLPGQPGDIAPFLAVASLFVGGAVTGLVVGCIGTGVEYRLRDKQAGKGP